MTGFRDIKWSRNEFLLVAGSFILLGGTLGIWIDDSNARLFFKTIYWVAVITGGSMVATSAICIIRLKDTERRFHGIIALYAFILGTCLLLLGVLSVVAPEGWQFDLASLSLSRFQALAVGAGGGPLLLLGGYMLFRISGQSR